VQIYCDFSGYTDVAIGSALLLGIRFPKNFDAPYQAQSIQDFWRRWHISLSTWLRDYLYIPLGGSRKGARRTYLNLIITMLLGGLWHGASWNFVVWGGLHGAALAATRAYQRWRWEGEPPANAGSSPLARLVCIAATFHAVCFAWIFFRAATFGHARLMLHQLTRFTGHHPNLPAEVLWVLGVGLLSHYVPERWFEGLQVRLVRSPVLVQGVLLFGVAWILRNMSGAETVPFVYFQF
jgi:D-alanyl-lipoteichoic acid acyltransferase DltB (MBOAT superfamily)